MNVGRSSFKLFISRGGSSLVFFAGITLFARWLNPESLGVFFTFLALAGVLSIPANAGIRGALEKRLSEGENPEAILGSALVFKLGTLTVVCVVVLLFAPFINRFAGGDIAVLLVFYLVVKEFSMSYISTVRGELRVGETASIQFGRRIVWILVGGALVSAGYGASGMILGSICSRGFEFVWAFAKSDTRVGSPSHRALRSLFAFSKYDTIISVGGRVYQWMDVLVIGFLLTQSDVGVYEMAWQVSLIVLVASKSIELTIFPQISHWDANASREQIEETVSTALRYTLFISIPALAGSLFYAEDILRYLFGAEYAVAALVLIVLMVEKLFQSINDVVGSTVRALDRVDLSAYVTVTSIGVNLLLSPILVVTIGIVGAAIATGVAWFVNVALNARYLNQLISFDIPYRFAGWYALASVLMSGVLAVATAVWPVTSAVGLIAHIGIGVVVYGVAVFVVPNVRNEVILPGVRTILA